jgi:high-affinity K+ transport system ATPase subunit B
MIIFTFLAIFMFRCAIKIYLIVLFFTFALLANTGESIAEGAGKNTPPEITQLRPLLDATTIPAEKVNKFVQAYLQVWQLISSREGELQAAETELESLRIAQEIETEALAIIEQAGLKNQEYLQLLGLANIDPEFGERVATQLQEAKS